MALPPTWGTGEYFIPLRLLLLARMIERETARDLQLGLNVTVAEWRVLATTYMNGSSSAAEICARFETDRAEVSRAVARLLKADLIERKPDPSHRQKMRITPTAAGREVFEVARAMREDYANAILQDFSPEERRDFDKAIKRIALRVDERRSARNMVVGDDPAPTGRIVSRSRTSKKRKAQTDAGLAGSDGDPAQRPEKVR